MSDESVRVKVAIIETTLQDFVAEYRRDELRKKEFRELNPLPCAVHAAALKIYAEDRSRVVGAAKFAGILTGAGAAFTGIYAVIEKILSNRGTP